MLLKYILCTIINTCMLFGSATSETCDRISTCSCECSQGLIDLQSLGTKNGPRYKDVPALDKYKYSYNLCDSFTETNTGAFEDHCHDVAACQVIGDVGTFQYYDTGKQDSVTYRTELGTNVGLVDVNTDVVVANYISADKARQTEVIFVCNDRDSNTAFDMFGEITTTPPTYRFILVSPECCFRSVSGLSGGSVLLIIAFSFLGAYLIVGIIIKKFVYKESGKELLPNVAFWSALPSLVKDGCLCVSRRGKYNPI